MISATKIMSPTKPAPAIASTVPSPMPVGKSDGPPTEPSGPALALGLRILAKGSLGCTPNKLLTVFFKLVATAAGAVGAVMVIVYLGRSCPPYLLAKTSGTVITAPRAVFCQRGSLVPHLPPRPPIAICASESGGPRSP